MNDEYGRLWALAGEMAQTMAAQIPHLESCRCDRCVAFLPLIAQWIELNAEAG